MDFPKFGTDGVRGLANAELTPEIAVALGRAAAEVLDSPTLVVGRDSRRSGPMLESALVAGITSAGADVELLGVVPTPAVAWEASHQNIAGAMISASHNPFADNGIKLFAPGGNKLSDAVESRIQDRFHQLLRGGASERPTGSGVGHVLPVNHARGWLDQVVASAEGVRFDGMKIVLDCANGSASAWAAEAYGALGADLVVIGDNPDGININDGVGSTYPQTLADRVVAEGADLGLAFDGDADRLIAIDASGAIVDGDHILAIIATDWFERGLLRHNTVVVTVMSNLGFHLAMERAGIDLIQTGVGDRYVLEALNEGNLSLGGEQSGHVICRDIASTGDGVLAGIQLVRSVLSHGETLAELAADAMTSVPQVLRNVRLPHQDPTLIDRIADQIAAAEADMGSDGRVLVRASGTEPLMRVMVEHIDDATASSVCDMLIRAVEKAVTD